MADTSTTVTNSSGTYDTAAPYGANLIPFLNNPVAGWHLVTFANGAIAALRWNSATNEWVWGSQTAPDSDITGVYWLGATIDAIGSDTATLWQALNHVSPAAALAVVASLDNGTLSLGQPVLWQTDKTGAVTGTSNVPGNEANPTNIVPSPTISTPSIFSSLAVFGTLAFWKGIGLVLAGVLVLVFAGLELRRL